MMNEQSFLFVRCNNQSFKINNQQWRKYINTRMQPNFQVVLNADFPCATIWIVFYIFIYIRNKVMHCRTFYVLPKILSLSNNMSEQFVCVWTYVWTVCLCVNNLFRQRQFVLMINSLIIIVIHTKFEHYYRKICLCRTICPNNLSTSGQFVFVWAYVCTICQRRNNLLRQRQIVRHIV